MLSNRRGTTFVLLLFLQATQLAPPASLSPTLRQLRDHLDEHRSTFGATPELTTAKHQLREWVESQLADLGAEADLRAFSRTLHTSLADARLLCADLQDECDWNFLGYVDDVRIAGADGFLIVITAVGIWCGFDESAYLYARDGPRWRRVWEHEQTTYTPQAYRPQTILDVQISGRDASGGRLLLTLGSQTICGGAFKDLYVRTWRVDRSFQSTSVLDWTAHANDAYPRGRVQPDEVLFQYEAGGLLSGDVHTAVRRFTFDRGVPRQIDPIAALPRDFVVEWLNAPWEESRTRSESASLEARHAELRRTDGVGDFPEPTVRCTADADVWQVVTHLYERPRRYYRIRWRPPFTFSVIDISEKAYADCTVADSRGETYSSVFDGDLR